MKKDYGLPDRKVHMVIKSPNDPSRWGLWPLKLGLGGALGLKEEIIYKHNVILDIFFGSLRRRNDGHRAGPWRRVSLVKKVGMDFGP